MVVQLGGDGSGLPYVGRWGFSDFLHRKWDFYVAVEARYRPRRLFPTTETITTITSTLCSEREFERNDTNNNLPNTFTVSIFLIVISNSEQIDTFENPLLSSSPVCGDNKREGRSPFPCHDFNPVLSVPHYWRQCTLPSKSSSSSSSSFPPEKVQLHNYYQNTHHKEQEQKKRRDYHNREEITSSKNTQLPQYFSHLGKVGKHKGVRQQYQQSSSTTLVLPTRAADLLENNNGLIWNGLVAQDALRNTCQWQ